ncbi:MAG: hypothetical protein KC917_04030 [Candidatus Omnitrophica bacterium]|nr:hypothetical protein [Candidatus Omnitrophota bacterium]MCA9415410.1 hypothetical protein [Candidatus Omnitrophota bacterium]MCA9429964.1 hypothetical protein [Candidatus Omnitrophota bacterium]MCA9440774.1 hypothetical protein [Candidatus Omnitrophota bacterium]MCB9766613.1 hypothetical protein [Candidatus Omnitrophota bacterium]
MFVKSRVVVCLAAISFVFMGCGGSPQPEKVVVKKETSAPPVVDKAPSSPETSPDEGNLGASHPQEAARDQEQAMSGGEQPSSGEHGAAPELTPKEGFKVAKAVDGMGRGTLHFLVPEDWESSQPSSSMRVGQYTIPGEAGPAELAIFGPMGGSVQMNIDRWIGQVEQPDGSSSKDKATQEKMQGDEFEFTLLDVTGTYKGMQMPGAAATDAQEDYRLLASIVETPSGPWFFKATGPHDTLEKYVEDFKELNKSIRMEGGGQSSGMGSFH